MSRRATKVSQFWLLDRQYALKLQQMLEKEADEDEDTYKTPGFDDDYGFDEYGSDDEKQSKRNVSKKVTNDKQKKESSKSTFSDKISGAKLPVPRRWLKILCRRFEEAVFILRKETGPQE